MFSKVLIANRGEIAARVIRTARAMGYRTVAVYSEADRLAPHVALADEAVCIGAAPVGESYLRPEKILDAAKRTGADAIHPGYGFLSENCGFAEACEQAGLTFIGPPVRAIELMGSKRLSKIAMIAAEVPCIPGYEGAEQDEATLVREAKRVGFPIMIKASAGGGGRGMRLVHEENDLLAQIKTARSEAQNAFGSGELILERAVIQPRHIEIQVFGDRHGNVVYLGERDCSIQRRHQKVVEEAPSPFVDPALRQRMGAAAVQAAKSCGYVGAGTVEFLVDKDKNFYFLEMNTRLQVEHPVTELITGFDLVEWQLNVAAGKPLPVTQEQITLTGHAIEVRLYAEDPAQNYTPQTGPIHLWQPACGEGIRIDAGIRSGQAVSPFYDPMLAKVIAYGKDREEARRRLIRALEDSVLFGVRINAYYLARILKNPAFIDGAATTAFLADHFANDIGIQTIVPQPLDIALATALLAQRPSGNRALSGWQSVGAAPVPYELVCGEQVIEVAATQTGQCFTVTVGDETLNIDIEVIDDTCLAFEHEGIRQTCHTLVRDNTVYLQRQGRGLRFEDHTHIAAVAANAAGGGRTVAPMDGAIVDVLVAVGDTVTKGQTLVILEAMKMEHPLKADADGVVKAVNAAIKDQVKLRQLLVELEIAE